MNVVIVGGKTGGHLFPGMALADGLKQKGSQVLFLCSSASLDRDLLHAHDIDYFPIPSGTPSGPLLSMTFVRFLVLTFFGVLQSLRKMVRFKPDVVVGLGGYPSVPGVLAAYLLRRPIVLLEQNSVPGRANSFLARFATKICTTFQESMDWFSSRSDRVVVTGNPLRRAFFDLSQSVEGDLWTTLGFEPTRPVVVVLGGSQGAKSLNQAVLSMVENFMEVQWVHVAGLAHYAQVKYHYEHIPHIRAKVFSFYEQMQDLLNIATVVIARAGATTIAELSALGKPAILVPIRNSYRDHQRQNARLLETFGAAEVVEETGALNLQLVGRLRRLIENPDMRQAMSDSVKSLQLYDDLNESRTLRVLESLSSVSM